MGRPSYHDIYREKGLIHPETEQVVRDLAGTGEHNQLTGLQGGTSGEYYHLTAAEYASLGSGGGTAWDFDEGDQATVYGVGTIDLEEGGP